MLWDLYQQYQIQQLDAKIDRAQGAKPSDDVARDAVIRLEEKLDRLADWERSELFDATERAVLAYTDAMTRDIHVPEDTFARVADLFPPQQLIEVTATIAAYNMVSRFLEALRIKADDPTTP